MNYRYGSIICKRHRQHNFSGELIPQKEEGIDKVCWVGKEEITDKLKNSFENIKQLLYDEIC